MKMKKRRMAAMIAVIVILLLVFGLLIANYVRYTNCAGADAADKPGCAAVLAGSGGAGANATATHPFLRFYFGKRYIEIG